MLDAVAAQRALEGHSPIPAGWEAFWVDKCLVRNAAVTGNTPPASQLPGERELNETLLVWCAVETMAALDRSA